jgi:nucleoside-diphosphate-sugar epimerase
MAIIITGSEGNIGRRLRRAFPGAVGIDIRPGAEIRANLEFIDYADRDVRRALDTADGLIHLATSADPDAPEEVHWQAVANAARLFAAAAERGVRRLVVASSDWADPADGLVINAYGHSKRVLEIMAAMYDHPPGRRGRAVRVGWVPRSTAELEGAPDWLRASYWDDARLVRAFRRALGEARKGKDRTGSTGD